MTDKAVKTVEALSKERQNRKKMASKILPVKWREINARISRKMIKTWQNSLNVAYQLVFIIDIIVFYIRYLSLLYYFLPIFY